MFALCVSYVPFPRLSNVVKRRLVCDKGNNPTNKVGLVYFVSLMKDVVEGSRDEGTTLKNLFLVPVLGLLVVIVLHCWPLLVGLLMNELVKGSSIK
jgi:hypothetical protein